MEKVLLFFPFYTQSYNRPRVLKTYYLSLLLIPKNYSIYFRDYSYTKILYTRNVKGHIVTSLKFKYEKKLLQNVFSSEL